MIPWAGLYRIGKGYYLLLLFQIGLVSLPLNSFAQNRYDILITEFLPDPSPPVGMPESSFIELTNRSPHDFNLRNWKISNGNTAATIKSDYILEPDSFLILCPSSAQTSFSAFGPSLGISGFPSLDNDAGDIMLISDGGNTIHALRYNKDWFGNILKASGGWSLEMIDPANPCGGKENWTSSIAQHGGTPGQKNSVQATEADSEPPSLISAITLDSLSLILIFDEAVDSASAADISNYSLSGGMGSPVNASTLAPFYDRVLIRLQTPLLKGEIYSVTVIQITDCAGNEITINNSCKTGIPEQPHPGDIIFNEILFNPPPYGVDYIELYNRGSTIISCSGLFITGRDWNGNLKDPLSLVKEERYLFPGEYLLITEDPAWVIHTYPQAPAAQILSMTALPSMPDDFGKIVLLDATGAIIDELDYDHHWHSPLLASETGVALERISPDLPTSLAVHWTSAAATAGYGTPGYKNSESSSADISGADWISANPKIFSPDMDGYQDFLFLDYHLPDPGFIGSISIFNVYGLMVRKLANNIIWGTSGSFRWDGLDDNMHPLSTGHYIIYVELFLPDGRIKRQKLVCVLAKK
jgi:Lamin Tail Domain